MFSPKRLFFIILSLVLISACRDDEVFLTDATARLTPSMDTVFFDTVFTTFTPGVPMSVTKQFTIYNPYKKTIKTSVMVGDGVKSYFRINADGESGMIIRDLEILPEDSIFVFVEVSVDPNQDPMSLPLIVMDSITITTNGNSQFVQLRAWGQDAHYFLRGQVCDQVFDDKLKPYVVYNYLYVPENCTLTIKPGVRLYFAPKSWLYVEGTLKIEGTAEEPVFLEGDRLQPDYEEIPGQWGGVWFDFLSKDNRINHARIKNGSVGIYCDSISSNGKPTVVVSNTLVRNMQFDGLSGKMSNIVAQNSVFDNCGRYSFLGLWGGKYDFKHCTFFTYNYFFARRDPTFVLNNIETDDFGRIIQTFDISYNVENCIVAGSLDEELGFGVTPDRVLVANFDHNLLKTKMKLNQGGLSNVLIADKSLIFKDYRAYDYHLIDNSAAIDIGIDVGVPLDLEGKARDAKPDAGAYEF